MVEDGLFNKVLSEIKEIKARLEELENRIRLLEQFSNQEITGAAREESLGEEKEEKPIFLGDIETASTEIHPDNMVTFGIPLKFFNQIDTLADQLHLDQVYPKKELVGEVEFLDVTSSIKKSLSAEKSLSATQSAEKSVREENLASKKSSKYKLLDELY
jgi:hypothetical protein